MHLNKILLFFLVMIVLSTENCFAMTFSKPVEIGKVASPPMSGFRITGATFNNGDILKASVNEYGKGIARFGNGSDALYFHYNSYLKSAELREKGSLFGAENVNNTCSIPLVEVSCTIQKISTDNGVILYLFILNESDRNGLNYIFLGKQKDGKFVKFIDFKQTVINYFGDENRYKYIPTHSSKDDNGIYFSDDTILIRYYKRPIDKAIGEFRFKWDDSAQWFGIEQVVY